MAWVRGELITASKLNEENKKIIAAKSMVYNNSNIVPSVGGFFFHGNKGIFFIYEGEDNPLFHVEKLLNGEWVEIYQCNNRCIKMEDLSNPGQGYYRIKFDTNFNTASWKIFPYQQDNVRGDFIMEFDTSTNSGNKIHGDILTVELMNSGRIGTSMFI